MKSQQILFFINKKLRYIVDKRSILKARIITDYFQCYALFFHHFPNFIKDSHCFTTIEPFLARSATPCVSTGVSP